MQDATLEIRDELPQDDLAVYQVERDAFESTLQADLVNALRKSAEPQLSLVAIRQGALVGHIFFSPVTFDATGAPPAAQLSPVAVAPPQQGDGIGSALIRAGLERCDSLGWKAVFLVGNPKYYSRFGFQLAGPHGLSCPGTVNTHLQFLELEPGSLGGVRGMIHFHPAFGGS